MPGDISCACHVSPFPIQGPVSRLRNVIDAGRHRGPVNHVTGDVHFLALSLPGSRTILTVHDCGNLHRLRGWRRAVLRMFWFTWPIAHCRIVTAVSEATRSELINLAGAPPEKVRVIHDCVSPEFIPVSAPFNAARPIILMLGTAPNKNLDRMTEALAGLPCSVHLVGRLAPDQADIFKMRGVELHELGDVDNGAIVAAYRCCDLVLFASTHEGFGLPILEAQATGRPVVTSNCSSMPEVAGDSACLVNPLDPASIRGGVQRVIQGTAYRERLIALGFENIKRFTPAKMAAEYASLYREIAYG
jgi:glycosyltransferase involved in cell wall biosynthesis